MREEYEVFFQSFKQFRKLNMSVLTPDINHTDYGILLTIECMATGTNCMKEGLDHAEAKKERNLVKVSQVTQHAHMNPTAVSRSLKTLEDRNLIIRNVNKKDRRITYVDLTEEGFSVLKDSEARLNDFADAVFQEMGDENLMKLTSYLNQMYEVADKELENRKAELGKEKQHE